MADRWPSFAVTAQDGRRVEWEGTLEPVQRRYRVRIGYQLPYAIEMFTIVEVQPRVQVLAPKLERHPEFEEGPVPHVYGNPQDRSLPFLCLFDPYSGEWSPGDLIAATTVPWTSRYLYFYEGWLVTGKWLGGGRHPTDEELGDDERKIIAAV
ncbi:MAG: hypothetical protein E7773_14990 [Sphingomonas sp.]|nr:MAG: hypothetical protein E7773_14990 [Sphingomonas sp.]